MAAVRARHFFDGMIDDCLCGHVDTHRKGFSGEEHFDEPLREKQFDHLFGEWQEIAVVYGIAIHANFCKEVELL